MHLEHVNITVSDIDRSIAWYSDLLDLHVRWKGGDSLDRPSAHVGRDDFYIAMFEAAQDPTDSPRVSNDYGQVGFNHVGFVVDDLDAIRARLAELGSAVHLEGDYEPGRRIYTYDPDGHEVEIVSYD